jgi:hypothetical protein
MKKHAIYFKNRHPSHQLLFVHSMIHPRPLNASSPSSSLFSPLFFYLECAVHVSSVPLEFWREENHHHITPTAAVVLLSSSSSSSSIRGSKCGGGGGWGSVGGRGGSNEVGHKSPITTIIIAGAAIVCPISDCPHRHLKWPKPVKQNKQNRW